MRYKSVRSGLGGLNHGDEAFQLVHMSIDVGTLAFQQVDAGETFLDGNMALRRAPITKVIEIDHLANISKAETDALGAQDPGEPCPIALQVYARRPPPYGRDQPLVLVEAKCACGDPELVGQIGDRIDVAIAEIGRVDCGVRAHIFHACILVDVNVKDKGAHAEPEGNQFRVRIFSDGQRPKGRMVKRDLDLLLDHIHAAFRGITGLKLVGDLHERPTWPGVYPPLDPLLRRRLARIREAGVLFIHIPKNAGMSVSATLYGEQLFHPTIRYYARVAPDVVRDLPSFAVWRDPVARFVSAYRFARNGGGPDARLARAFRKRYMAFRSIDDAIDHVEQVPSLYHTDHIFRPQFWYVADAAGRIAVDQICLIENLDQTVAAAGLPGLSEITRLNLSPELGDAVTAEQLVRLRKLYAIDFAIYNALENKDLPAVFRHRAAA